jgi:hypothetical protein
VPPVLDIPLVPFPLPPFPLPPQPARDTASAAMTSSDNRSLPRWSHIIRIAIGRTYQHRTRV